MSYCNVFDYKKAMSAGNIVTKQSVFKGIIVLW